MPAGVLALWMGALDPMMMPVLACMELTGTHGAYHHAHAGGLAAVVERLEDVSGFFQRKPTGSDMAQQAGKATPPVKLSKAQRRTLEKLDQWAAAEGSERQGAVRAYGAAGVRADLVQSYGRLLLRSKQVRVGVGVRVRERGCVDQGAQAVRECVCMR